MLNMNPSVFFVTGFAVCLTACQEKPQDEARVEAAAEARKVPEWKDHSMLGYEVIREFPHDAAAFTQGLLVSQGQWIESTGGYGTSGIRRIESHRAPRMARRARGKQGAGRRGGGTA